jgi:oxygen-independent coproporphyrinogen-3 oxidase
MVKIQVKGLDETFSRHLEIIASLFFDEVVIVLDEQYDPVDFLAQFSLQVEDPIQAGIQLIHCPTGQVFSSNHQRTGSRDEDRHRKRVKQAVDYVFLSALQKATGQIQPWGILTGVRPTKLLHTLLLQGNSLEEAERILREEYLLQPEKIEILKEIVERQTSVLPDLYHLEKEVSLYIGIPFCPTKCAYCTFPAYAIQGRTGTVEAFLQGLHEEIAAVGTWLKEMDLPVTTIYFGGGTPTSITAEQMDALFTQLKTWIPKFEQVREWTVEAGRPDTLDEEKLALLKQWKVDRISINPQSFREETLKQIGRHHTVKETLEKYQLARKMGLTNINMDLIIGLPDEGIETFQHSLKVIEELRPESLTVHTLSFKRGSTMTQNKGNYRVAERDEVEEMVKLAREWAKEHGYVPYYLYRQKNILGNQENVGYALPGNESLYNIIIMEERHTIIGLGCGAVSKIISPSTGKLHRLPNPKEPQAYIQMYRSYINEKIYKLNEVYKK